MKTILFLAIIILSVMAGCHKPDDENKTPDCLTSRIQDFEQAACDTGATVKEYTFQGNTVYVFDPGLCGADMASPVIDSDCVYLGFLGGFTGNTIINGEDFSSATYIKTIWEN